VGPISQQLLLFIAGVVRFETVFLFSLSFLPVKAELVCFFIFIVLSVILDLSNKDQLQVNPSYHFINK
jgi:hypothetical protein